MVHLQNLMHSPQIRVRKGRRNLPAVDIASSLISDPGSESELVDTSMLSPNDTVGESFALSQALKTVF